MKRFTCKIGHGRVRLLALVMSAITLASSIVTYAAGTDYYRDTLGTNKALGSPLSNAEFSAEDWNKWEMTVFGMFIGNYVKLGEEDYSTAFKSGGEGLKAMQFAAGGDANANGTLRKMLNICMTAQKANYTQLSTRYRYTMAGKITNLDLGKRQAKLKDLFPIAYNKEDSFEIKQSADLENPVIAAAMKKDHTGISDDDYNNLDGIGGDEYMKTVDVLAVYHALLPEITVTVGTTEKKLFNLNDGYDAQIMQGVIQKMRSTLKDDGIDKLLDENPDLVMDAFGNICALSGGKPIVIIPSAANKNVNKNNKVNLLNSIIVNGMMVGSNETQMTSNAFAGYIESDESRWTGWTTEKKATFMGMPAVCGKSEVKRDKLIAYSDTDPMFFGDYYNWMQQELEVQDKIADVESGSGFPLLTANQDSNGNPPEATDPNTGETEPDGTTDPNAGTTDPNTGGTEPDGTEIQGDGATSYTVTGLNTGDLDIKASNLNFGRYVNSVLDANSMHRAPFKLEVTGVDVDKAINFNRMFWSEDEVTNSIVAAQIALSCASNMNEFILPEDSLQTMLLVNGGKDSNKTDLFSGHYYLTPNVTAIKGELVGTRFYKDFAAYAFKAMDGSLNAATNPAEMRTLISGLSSPAEIFSVITAKSSAEANGLISESRNNTKKIKVGTLIKQFANTRYDIGDKYESLLAADVFLGSPSGGEGIMQYLSKMKPQIKNIYNSDDDAIRDTAAGALAATRVCKVYKPSSVFEAVGKIYDLDKTALFKQYTTNMYVTYLDWYGILDDKSEKDMLLDTELFNGQDYLNIDADELVDAMTEEEKQKLIQNNMVKLLSTDESGKEYRGELAHGIWTSAMEKAYAATVDKDSLGFLNVSGYRDNPLTSFIFKNWELISTTLFGSMFVILIVIGILKKRSLTWLLLVEGFTLSSALAIPAYVEMVPYICNNAVQKSFHENSVFWLASEQVNNSVQNNNMATNNSIYSGLNMTDQEIKEAVVLMSSTRVQQSDRTLLVKLDTSKKVIDQLSIGWDKLQQKASTRWLVPSLIQQLSTDNDSYDYVYITTFDWLANMSRGYLASLPADASSFNASVDYNSAYGAMDGAFMEGEFNGIDSSNTDNSLNVGSSLASKQQVFPSYVDTSAPGSLANQSSKSTTRLKDDGIDSLHTRIYFMPKESLKFNDLSTLGDSAAGMQEADWDALANNPSIGVDGGFKDAFIQYNTNLLDILNSYNRYESEVDMKFANLWCTEGPGLYFYSLVKDIFPISSSSVDYISQQLLGGITTSPATDGSPEKTVRTTFMHYGDTGYVRDVLDLEELFTNVLPYLYAEQIVAGGSNGKNGLVGEDTLGDNYSVYKDNLNSWLYRSNWVTKLMTDPVYKKPGSLRYIDASGNKVSGSCSVMIDPRTYPRAMVFSEAQQKEMGLNDSDLTLLEIKLVKLNKQVCKDWTELINYANIKDMTPEIMERLMTVTAVTNFNEIVTRTNPLNATMSLYPRDIDLRNVSWDSLLRHMLVSATNNSEYMSTSNVMTSIWNTSGLVAAILTLLVSITNSAIIPFMRDLLLMLMLYLVFASVIFNTLKSWQDKLKAQSGWAISYALFAMFTGIFYFLLARVIGTSNSAKVLATGEITTLSSASVTFKMLMLFVLDFMYVIGLYKYMKNVVFKGGLAGLKAYMQDGGFSFFYDCASSVTGGLHRGFRGLSNSVGGIGAMMSSNKKEVVAVENKKGTKLDANVDGKVKASQSKSRESELDTLGTNSVNDTSYVLDDLARQSRSQVERNKSTINDMIDKGKNSTDNTTKTTKSS